MKRNENENTLVQNLWAATKAVRRWGAVAIQIFLQTRAKSQIHNLTNLTLHVKELEKGAKTKSDAEP